MRPEEALAHARAEAERKRAEGRYPAQAGVASAHAEVTLRQLRQWALVSVDPELVYSTRRLGAPITWLKRLLLRLLRQYTTELEAQQTRFNVGVLAYLERLERRRGTGE